MMTNWLPDLNQGSGPLYLRLANHAEGDIAAGKLPHGSKLPPQRNLAYDLGITVGTVGRAYALLRERGLVNGETGRGTYVQNGGTASSQTLSAANTRFYSGSRDVIVPRGKLTMDSTAAPNVGQADALGRIAANITRDYPSEIASYARRLPASWQEAGQRWLKVGDWQPQVADIVPSLGGHAAILAVIAAVTSPGDKVAFEQLTYSSMARSTDLIGRRSIAINMDEFGPDPDELERVCAQQHPKLLFLVPDLHNPTLTIMPETRRRQIIEIARRHNVWLIEDAIYGALLDERPVSIAELAPERTFHVSSLSKSVAAGIRGGWVACPPHLAKRVMTAQKMITGGIPFLMSELAANLVLSGEADAIRNRVKTEIAARVAIARQGLEGYDFQSHDSAPFLWLKLPEPWLSGTLRQAAANENVLIDDEDEFKSGRTEKTFHRVRIGFSAPIRAEVEGGFARIRSLLDNGMAGYDSYG